MSQHPQASLAAPQPPPASRARRAPPAATSTGVLPPDVLFEVLARLPVKDLCRFRAVSRAWRALTSDGLFIAEHAARNPGPFLLAKFSDEKTVVCVLDLAGNVLKRIAGAAGGPSLRLLRTRLDLACLASYRNRCRVLNPATGAVHVLPESPAAEHVNRATLRYPYTFFALGRVASTGEHKVLRMFNRPSFAKGHQQFFEVFTINGGAGHGQWRAQQNPGLFVEECSGVVVGGVVYFLTSSLYDDVCNGIRADYIISFDLGEEEWRRDLRGPISCNLGSLQASFYKRHHLTLAELKGSLVLADNRFRCMIDLWFLVDFRSGLWVKEYHIQTKSIHLRSADEYHLKPLLMLDDGRLVIYLVPAGRLFIYDPATNTIAQVDMRRLDSVGVYTGNLLSVE